MSFHNRFVRIPDFFIYRNRLLLHYKGKSLQLPCKMAERDGIRTDVADLIPTQVQQGLFGFRKEIKDRHS